MNCKMVNNPIKMGKRLDNPQKKICIWQSIHEKVFYLISYKKT